MNATVSKAARIVLILAAMGAAASRFHSVAAPESSVEEIEAASVVFAVEPAAAASAPAAADEAMQHVVIVGKRMTPEQKAAYDADQQPTAYAAPDFGALP
ncbi:hypothetical protein E4K72_15445 [Oxalobacteraceae bacterium OM1]|nr:hypothetical protein E4K72_15445 [Oxalobacteraceae bacterium OM1]